MLTQGFGQRRKSTADQGEKVLFEPAIASARDVEDEGQRLPDLSGECRPNVSRRCEDASCRDGSNVLALRHRIVNESIRFVSRHVDLGGEPTVR